MDQFLCPKCRKKSIIKQKAEKEKYMFICQTCGFKQGILANKDRKRGVRWRRTVYYVAHSAYN